MIEGGPHLGDCTCWAAAALRGSSTQLKAIGIEAMADAAAHFKETVRINNFERVQVRPRKPRLLWIGERTANQRLARWTWDASFVRAVGSDSGKHPDCPPVISERKPSAGSCAR